MNSKPIPANIPAIISSSTHQTKNVKLEKQLSPPPMGPIPCVAPATTDLANEVHQDSAPCTSTAKRPTATKRWDQQSGDDIVTLFPRRKAGQNRPGGGKGPVVLTLELLEQFYGMPLHVAAKRLVSARPPNPSLAIRFRHEFSLSHLCWVSYAMGVPGHLPDGHQESMPAPRDQEVAVQGDAAALRQRRRGGITSRLARGGVLRPQH